VVIANATASPRLHRLLPPNKNPLLRFIHLSWFRSSFFFNNSTFLVFMLCVVNSVSLYQHPVFFLYTFQKWNCLNTQIWRCGFFMWLKFLSSKSGKMRRLFRLYQWVVSETWFRTSPLGHFVIF
jgi:hypothetical protein